MEVDVHTSVAACLDWLHTIPSPLIYVNAETATADLVLADGIILGRLFWGEK